MNISSGEPRCSYVNLRRSSVALPKVMNRMLGLSVFCVVAIVAAQANPVIDCPAIVCDPICPQILCVEGTQQVTPSCACCPTCGILLPVGSPCPSSDMDWQCADGSVCLDGTCSYSTGGPYWPTGS